MQFTFLDNAQELRRRFRDRFVMPWEEFRIRQADWIAKLAKQGYEIDQEWYARSFMWDKMSPDYPSVSFRDTLAFLRAREEPVYFLSEASDHHSGSRMTYLQKHDPNFAVTCSAPELAELIEREWFEDYRLAEQNMYNPDPILPDELYIFDRELTWCVVFTHETTDWDSELDDPMKAAESRYCILVPPC